MNCQLLSLPDARSVRVDDITWDRTSYNFVYPKKVLETTSKGLDAQDLLAFSCLVVFSRLSQLSNLCIKCGEVDIGLTLTPDSTLIHALLDLSTNPQMDIDHNRINLEIIPHAPPSEFCPGANDETLFLYFEQLGKELRLTLLFNNSVTTKLSAQDLLEKLSNIVNGLAYSPDCLISEVDLLTEVAREIVPNPDQEICKNRFEFVPTTLLKVAERFSNQSAIGSDSDSYSYAELRTAALHLASRLAAAGVEIGDIVTVSGRSSFGMIASAIAIMHVGGVLVTIDENLPQGRQKQLADLTNAKYKVQIISGKSADNSLSDCIVMRDWPEHAELEALGEIACPTIDLPDDASAYIFFTSGSTGVPKGVLGTHLGLAHFLDWQRSQFPIGPGDRSAQVTALSFDVVLRDIFYPLTSGATIYIPSRDTIFDARKMLAWISDYRISVLHIVPSLMKAWLIAETGNRSFRSLKYIFFAGEPLTDVLLTSFKNSADQQTRIVNLYGPTETTLAKLANPIDEIEVGVQPIGKPQSGVDVFIMRDRRTICGLGEIGEITIRTPYRSKGYFMNEELTGQVFVKNPFRDDSSDLLYFTGDLGRYRSDGKVEIFGRKDFQVKINGVRIELGEIESVLETHFTAKDSVVVAKTLDTGKKELIAYVKPANGMEIDPHELRKYVQDKLPSSMCPSYIVPISEFPQTPTGKINRKELESRDITKTRHMPPTDERLSENERIVLDIWKDQLGVEAISVEDNFFDIGGDSLSAVLVCYMIEQRLGRSVEVGTLFQFKNVRALVATLESSEVRDCTGELFVPLNRVQDGMGAHLFCICGIHLYEPLAQLLDTAHRVSGIYLTVEDLALRGERELPSLEELASMYGAVVRRIQPKGPYRLAGLSFGGMLAYEIARQFMAQGEKVDLLAMFDVMLPQNVSTIAKIGAHFRIGIRQGPSYFVSKLLKRLPRFLQRQNVIPEFVDTNQSEAKIDLAVLRNSMYARAEDAYRRNMPAYEGAAIFFRASERSMYRDLTDGPDCGWHKFIRGHVDAYEVPGNHITMLQEQNVRSIADILRRELDLISNN